jgi:signal transduction histidine kinase/CheY-like chemotaxis protein
MGMHHSDSIGIEKDKFESLLGESAHLVMEDLYHFSVLRRMGEIVSMAGSFQEVCSDLCRIMLEELPLQRIALIMEMAEDELEVITSQSRWSEGESDGRGWSTKDRIQIGEGDDTPFHRAWNSNRPWVEDLQAQEKDDTLRFVGIPFSCLGKRGILCMLGSANRPVDSRDYALWTLLSNQITLVLEAISLLEQERRWSNVLEERVRERTSDLEEAHGELIRTRDQLIRSEKLKALGQMASGIAHDFNNVLATILGYCQLYIPKAKEPDLLKCMQVIEQAAWDGAATVRRVQEFAGVSRTRSTVERVSVNRLLREVREITRPRWRDQAQKEGRTVHFELNLAEVPHVMGHAGELREALANIIFNGLDAMPVGGTIHTSTRVVDSTVEVIVADTGEGIQKEDLPQIFDPFFTTKGLGHSGLGLSTSYGIVHRHNGEIQIESDVDQGTTVRVQLPVTSSERTSPAVGEVPSDVDVEDSSARILIIEDEPSVREILDNILKSKKHEVQAAASGREGLETFRTHPFDLVITDLGMPEMSGWEVAQKIRENDQSIPIILMTGWGMEISPEEWQDRGISTVIPKPFQAKDILATVARLLMENKSKSSADEP